MTNAVRGIHHVGIVTGDITAAIERWSRLFGAAPGVVRTIDRPGARMRTVMLGIGDGTYLQIIEPLEGRALEHLHRNGEGSLYELALLARPLEVITAQLASQGVHARDLLGQPLAGAYATAQSGSLYAYLDPRQTGGTLIELLEPAT